MRGEHHEKEPQALDPSRGPGGRGAGGCPVPAAAPAAGGARGAQVRRHRPARGRRGRPAAVCAGAASGGDVPAIDSNFNKNN